MLKRWARLAVAARRLTADAGSLRRYAALDGAPGDPVEVRLKPLGGRPVWLRPGTSDGRVAWDTFRNAYHLPPDGLEPGLIFDLGANIGLTVAHLATLYPDARVVGVELDPGNAELARRNVEPWSERCEIVEAGVWPEDGKLRYHRHANPSGYNVTESGDAAAPALSLSSLFERHAPGSQVDYLKMDIEGSEHSVLKRHTDWAERVRCISVEVHFGYGPDECEQDLRKLGFETARHPRHPKGVTGRRLARLAIS